MFPGDASPKSINIIHIFIKEILKLFSFFLNDSANKMGGEGGGGKGIAFKKKKTLFGIFLKKF